MAGGLKIKRKKQDLMYEKAFGASHVSTPFHIGRFETIMNSPLKNRPLYQSDIPSCVACSATFVNSFNSFKEGNDAALSWVFLYSLVKHYPNGTVPQEVFDALRKIGQVKDDVLPQERYWNGGAALFLDNLEIPNEWKDAASQYRIDKYFQISDLSYESIFAKLVDSPVIVGVYVDPETWFNGGTIFPGKKGFGHCIVVVDVDSFGNYQCISWDSKDNLDVRILDKSYPIEFAMVLRDLPDNMTHEQVQRGFSLKDFVYNLCNSKK